MEPKKKPEQEETSALPIGMCLGLAIGTAIGAATGSMAVWTGIGVALGVAVGASLDAAKKKSVPEEDAVNGKDEEEKTGDS